MRKSFNPCKPFVVDFVREAFRHKASRMSLYRSLLSKTLLSFSDEVKLTQIRSLWVNQLYRLRKAGWGPVSSELALIFAANCPPVGVSTSDRTRSCKRAMICPFCYSRERIRAPFIAAENVLYGCAGQYKTPDGTLLPLIRPELRIVAFRRIATVSTRLGSDHVAACWSAVQQLVTTTRRAERVVFNGLYGFTQFQVYPTKQGLAVARCGFTLTPRMPSAAVLADYSSSAPVRYEVFEPSKENLYEALVKYSAYPRKLLAKANAPMIADMLSSMPRMRLASWYGKYDSKTGFEEED